MLSRFVTVLVLWFVGSVAAPPAANVLPPAIDHAIEQVTAAGLGSITVLASDRRRRGVATPATRQPKPIADVPRRESGSAVPNYLQRVEVYSPHLDRPPAYHSRRRHSRR
jgi:hypothetical protein